MAPRASERRRRLKYVLAIGVVVWVQLLLQRDTASCRFTLGLAQLRSQIGPSTVEGCLGDEAFDPAAGSATQPTARGLLVWRKADGGTAFSDGHRAWLAGPFGLQQRLNDERFCWERCRGGAWRQGTVPARPRQAEWRVRTSAG